MFNYANALGERPDVSPETPLEKSAKSTIDDIKKYPDKIGERLNGDDFGKKLHDALVARGEAWTQLLKAHNLAPNLDSSKDIPKGKDGSLGKGKDVSGKFNFDFDYSDLPTTFTTKFMERSGTSVSDAVTTLEGKGDKEKQLASLLKACKENPCSGNVIALQDSLAKDWGKKISKSGKSDGDFGPMTMEAINNIAGNNIQKSKDVSVGNSRAGEKVAMNQVLTPKATDDTASSNDAEKGKSEKTASTAPESNGKSTEGTEKINVAGEKVASNGDKLKNEITTIKGQTNLFNISSQVDKATPVVKRYLEENIRDLNLLADNQASLNPETKAKISSQLKELSDGLHKGASSGMVSENSRSQMARWVPEVDKIRNRLA